MAKKATGMTFELTRGDASIEEVVWTAKLDWFPEGAIIIPCIGDSFDQEPAFREVLTQFGKRATTFAQGCQLLKVVALSENQKVVTLLDRGLFLEEGKLKLVFA